MIFNKTNNTILFFFCILFLLTNNLFAQKKEYTPPKTRLLFILDASNSMNGRWDKNVKFTTAKQIFINLLDSLQNVPNLELALRVYGHQTPANQRDCKDTRLEVPFSANNINQIKHRLKYIKPKGNTPIAYSLLQGAKDFPQCNDCRNIIILITDGKEECDADPCAISIELQKKGIILEPFVIGIGLDLELKDAFECMGKFYDASDAASFKTILNIVVTQALNPTTAQVNLLDIHQKPVETNVPYSLTDIVTQNIMYNYVHTMNNKGLPDTLHLDHLRKYNLTAYTIPSVHHDSIELTGGIHNILAVDAPQGYIDLKVNGTNEYSKLQCIVKQDSCCEILNVQDFGTTEKYLVGNYDIDILCLPRIHKENIPVNQNKTTTISIDAPGVATFHIKNYGYGAIFMLNKQEQIWVKNIDFNFLNQSYVMQPGQYKIVFRTQYVKQTIYTIEKNFTIKSGESNIIKLY